MGPASRAGCLPAWGRGRLEAKGGGGGGRRGGRGGGGVKAGERLIAES